MPSWESSRGPTLDHRTYISGVEGGTRNPTVIVIEKIAKALCVAGSRLLEETGHVRN